MKPDFLHGFLSGWLCGVLMVLAVIVLEAQ